MSTYMYRGALIMPMPHNSWGGRWEARVDVPGGGVRVSADTLAGVRELIRDTLGPDPIPRDTRGRFTRRGQRCTVYLMPGGRCSLSHGHARRHRLT